MKYRLTNETKIVDGHKLHRIECLEAFGSVEVGDKGGWIEKEENLSQHGRCWAHNNACVYGNASVFGDANVFDNARVYGDVVVSGNAWVSGKAQIFGKARVGDNAIVCNNAKVSGNADVSGRATIAGNANVESNEDYIIFKDNRSSCRYLTWTRSNDEWEDGCFHGTGEELIKKAYADSENSGKHYEACVKFVEQLKAMED